MENFPQLLWNVPTSVGKLMEQVVNAGKEKGLQGTELQDLINHTVTGMTETGNVPRTALKYSEAKPLTVGLMNPLTMGFGKTIGEPLEIPGSTLITGPLGKAYNAVRSTPTVNALMKALIPGHVPTNVPESVLVNDITRKSFDNIEKGDSSWVPVGKEKLTSLKNELEQITPMGKKFNVTSKDLPGMIAGQKGLYTSFDEISNRTGAESTFLKLIFEHELPFTMDLKELYQTFQKSAEHLGVKPDNEVLFEQAARLRKTMDLMADHIPLDVKHLFKGTVITPEVITSYEGSPLKYLQTEVPASPMINYVFNSDGVDIFAGVNAGKSFNDNIWTKVRTTIATLHGMLKENLDTLKKHIQITPVKLGGKQGSNVLAYTEDGVIVLGDVSHYTVTHEYSHIMDRIAGGDSHKYFSNTEGYANAADKDAENVISKINEVHPGSSVMNAVRQIQESVRAGEKVPSFISNYAKVTDAEKGLKRGLLEDMADSVAMYTKEPELFKQFFPNRTRMIEEMLAKTKTDPARLQELIRLQEERATKMEKMKTTGAQIDDILGNVESKIMEDINIPRTVSGTEAFKEFYKDTIGSYESTSTKVEDLLKQTEMIFKDIPLSERKQIMDIAATTRTPETLMAKGSDEVYLYDGNKKLETIYVPVGSSRETVEKMISNYAKKYNIKYDNVRISIEGNAATDLDTAFSGRYLKDETLHAKGGLPSENVPGFYSKLGQVVEQKMGGSMPAEDLKKMLLANNVKPDEMKWLGLDEYLVGKTKVTKQENSGHPDRGLA